MSLPYLYKKRKWVISLTFVSSGKILLRRREFGRVTKSQSHGTAQLKCDTVQMMHFPKMVGFPMILLLYHQIMEARPQTLYIVNLDIPLQV